MTHLMTEDTDTGTYWLSQIATCCKLISNTNYIDNLIIIGFNSSVIPTCRPYVISVTTEVCSCSCIEYIDEIHSTVIIAVILCEIDVSIGFCNCLGKQSTSLTACLTIIVVIIGCLIRTIEIEYRSELSIAGIYKILTNRAIALESCL